jgi:hypothetical protein
MPAIESLRELVERRVAKRGLEGNITLGAARHLHRALEFVELASAEYQRDLKPWLEEMRKASEEFEAIPLGSHEMTQEELAWEVLRHRLAVSLHLRIETFYVFAQVALDALVAVVDELRERKSVTLGRHRNVLQNLDLAHDKGEMPAVPDELRALIAEVTDRIKDYRDDFVVHVREPRQLKGTGFQLDTDEAFIQAGLVMPKKGETLNARSESPPALLALLDAYLEAWVRYLDQAFA